MKDFYIVLLFCTFPLIAQTQTDPNESKRNEYHHYYHYTYPSGTFNSSAAERVGPRSKPQSKQQKNNVQPAAMSQDLQSEINSLKMKLQKQNDLINQLKTTCLNLKKENKIMRQMLTDANVPLPDITEIKTVSLDPNDDPITPEPKPASEPAVKKDTLFTIDKSDQMQAQRKELLEKLIANGVFKKIEKPGSFVHVWVDGGFTLIEYDMKKSFLEVVYCYFYDGKNGSDGVILKNNLTGKRIGSYDPILGLDLK